MRRPAVAQESEDGEERKNPAGAGAIIVTGERLAHSIDLRNAFDEDYVSDGAAANFGCTVMPGAALGAGERFANLLNANAKGG